MRETAGCRFRAASFVNRLRSRFGAAGAVRKEHSEMGKIRVHEFISLDGVIDTPSWTMGFGFDPRMGEAIGACMGSCEALLLGRTTFEMFEPAWSVRTADEDPGAPFMNDRTKYVVSSTLTSPTWRNSEVLGGYDPAQIQALKDRTKGLYVSGSGTLVRALLADGLVDELHLFVYPLTRGAGPRLFGEHLAPATWDRADGALYDNGVSYLKLTQHQ
jgi:dihydrofolate reductase